MVVVEPGTHVPGRVSRFEAVALGAVEPGMVQQRRRRAVAGRADAHEGDVGPTGALQLIGDTRGLAQPPGGPRRVGDRRGMDVGVGAAERRREVADQLVAGQGRVQLQVTSELHDLQVSGTVDDDMIGDRLQRPAPGDSDPLGLVEVLDQPAGCEVADQRRHVRPRFGREHQGLTQIEASPQRALELPLTAQRVEDADRDDALVTGEAEHARDVGPRRADGGRHLALGQPVDVVQLGGMRQSFLTARFSHRSPREARLPLPASMFVTSVRQWRTLTASCAIGQQLSMASATIGPVCVVR